LFFEQVFEARRMDKYWQKRGQGGCLVAGAGLFGCMAESQGTNVKRMGQDGRSWAARSKELGRHFLSNAATRSRWIWKKKKKIPQNKQWREMGNKNKM